ncbi:hypothetical protein [Methylobacterium aquaticum]|uniref:Uncharacterized protein n=1 Tax=Methylobacterium aquaticum TaxID=270351 RepID=A0A0C6FC82_9HYPH|nr:hypothetical protein [Methylobacterium aquaticum]BAQ50271.1 hypothetical protein Maq22A_3p50080 [Methylobacterium aquaticum]
MSDQTNVPTDTPTDTREAWLEYFEPLFDHVREEAARTGEPPEAVVGRVAAETLADAAKPLAFLVGLVRLEMIPIKLPPEFKP